MNNNINFDENTVNKLKDMMNSGQLNDVISKIPPEMIQNFSSMMGQQSLGGNSNNTNNNSGNERQNTNTSNNFDFYYGKDEYIK